MRFTIRRFMIVVASMAIVLAAAIPLLRPGPPARVLQAVQKEYPGIVINHARSELFNNAPAWEVIGTDPKGVRWMIDVYDKGEIVMYEKINW